MIGFFLVINIICKIRQAPFKLYCTIVYVYKYKNKKHFFEIYVCVLSPA